MEERRKMKSPANADPKDMNATNREISKNFRQFQALLPELFITDDIILIQEDLEEVRDMLQ